MQQIGKKYYRELIMKRAEETRTIRAASIELLNRCTFRCKHCFILGNNNEVITVQLFKKIADELKELGCTWMLLTGGEVMLHPHFLQIYEYAYNLGFSISVFTNGSTVSEEVFSVFKKMRPELIEISLYGCDNQSYEWYTRQSNVFEEVDKTIQRFKADGHNIVLKTVLTKELLVSYHSIKEYAAQVGLKLRHDGFILPEVENNCANRCQLHRLTPEEVFSIDKQSTALLDNARKLLAKNDEFGKNNALYSCSAGINNIFIDSQGMMEICMMSRHLKYDLKKERASISEGKNILQSSVKAYPPLSRKDKCFNCKTRIICRYCPGVFLSETGDLYTPSSWNCEYTHLLAHEIGIE